MITVAVASLRKLNDRELLAGMSRIARTIRDEQVRGLMHLAEIEARQAYLPLGYGSLWAYLTGELKFSESVTSRWTRAMRVTRLYPLALEMMAAGRLSLCAVSMLCDSVNGENAAQLLAAAEGRNKMQVQELVVAVKPLPAKKDVIFARNLSGRGCGTVAPVGADGSLFGRGSVEVVQAPALDRTPSAAVAKVATVTPQAPQVWRIAFNASASTKAKLKRLQELRSGASIDEVIGAALDVLLEKIAPERRLARREVRQAARAGFAKSGGKADAGNSAKKGKSTGAPRATRAAAADAPQAGRRRRAVPVAVKDVVSCRDRGRCSFVSSEGRRCETRGFLEYDHTVQLAFGGGNGVEDLRLLCHRHHRMVTREAFGPGAVAP